MKNFLSILLSIFLHANSLSQNALDSVISSNSNAIADFIEKLGGIEEVDWNRATRDDTKLIGMFHNVFDKEKGKEYFDIYKNLGRSFWYGFFNKIEKDSLDSYYEKNMKNFEYDSVLITKNIIDEDGGFDDEYLFYKDGVKVRFFSVYFIKGIQILGWKDEDIE
jgi:hypothetical protein